MRMFTAASVGLVVLLVSAAAAVPVVDSTTQASSRRLLAQHAKHRTTTSTASSAATCCSKLPAGFNSTLPVVIVDLRGAPFSSIPKPQIETGVKAKIPASVCTCNSPDGRDLNGTVGFSERGSHSEDYNVVRSYSLDLDGSSRFLGMPKGKSWALYGPQNDTLGFHDWLGFYLYRLTGNYAARTQYIELFVSDGRQPLRYPEDYLGLYLAMEHIEKGVNRVNVKRPSSSDVTGGYILDNEHGKTKQGDVELPPLNYSRIQYLVEYPKNPTQAMQEYILGYLQDFEATLFSPSYADPASGWRKLANGSSAIDYFLFEELIKSNNNGYRGSQRLNKDAGGPLNFGPPWDFNDGFGLCCGFPVEGYQSGGASNGTSGGSAISPEGWTFSICEQPERCKVDPINGISLWFRRMWQDLAFQATAAARFLQLRGSVWTDAAISAAVKDTQAYIHDAALRTFAKWPVDFLNPYAPPQPDAESQLQATVDKLVQWTTSRLAWMEDQFNTRPAADGAAAAAPASLGTTAGQANTNVVLLQEVNGGAPGRE